MIAVFSRGPFYPFARHVLCRAPAVPEACNCYSSFNGCGFPFHFKQARRFSAGSKRFPDQLDHPVPVRSFEPVLFKPSRPHEKREHDPPCGHTGSAQIAAVLFRCFKKQCACSLLLPVPHTFFMAVYPDAVYVIQAAACDWRMFYGDILDHPDDFTLFIFFQFNAQALLLLFFKP